MKINGPIKNGFTLVEVLVTISIMCLLMAISISVYHTTVINNQYSRAESDLKVISLLFENYIQDNGDLPPIGEDHCDACITVYPYNDPAQYGTWQEIVDIMRNTNYPFKIPSLDPWGAPYSYDKNYNQPCPATTIICSTGPNKVQETDLCQLAPNTVTTGDDICIWIVGPIGQWP